MSEADVSLAPASTALLVEDLHAGIGDERVLFHLLNLVREHKLSMLLTSRVPAGELAVSLPDLDRACGPCRSLPSRRRMRPFCGRCW